MKTKKISFFLFVFCLLILVGCNKDEMVVTTGIIAKVEYGYGDCMPSPDPKLREYKPYNGKVYFIVKEDFDNLGNGDYDKLKSNSISVTIKNGNLSAELPVGTYLIEVEDVYQYSAENTIIIKSGEVIRKDFSFFKCTSY
jgi:hypothetical protein